jgi:hypothetical protein
MDSGHTLRCRPVCPSIQLLECRDAVVRAAPGASGGRLWRGGSTWEVTVNASSGWSAFDTSAPSPGWRGRKETLWQYMERSTDPIAVDTRTRWDSWLARMPTEPRDALIVRLKGRIDSQVRDAVAELVTFVLLDSVYPAAVEVEPETGTGSRTDFAVNTPARTHFEVRRKTEPAALAGDVRRRADLAEELEKIESPDFWLSVDVFSGAQVPSMRQVRQNAEEWLASLDYDDQVRRHDQEQQARSERLAQPMPGLDAGSLERATYLAAQRQYQPPVLSRSGQGWRVEITAYPRPAGKRGPGQLTIGIRTAGELRIADDGDIEAAIDRKLGQHKGLTDSLVIVLDLSAAVIDNAEIAAALYGPVTPAGSRDRKKAIWPEALREPPRPAAVLTLRGIWPAWHEASADLWLPPSATSPVAPGPWSIQTLGQDQQSVITQAATRPAADSLK